MEGNMFNKNETIKVKGVAVLLLMFHHLFYNANQVEQSGIKFLLLSEEASENKSAKVLLSPIIIPP